MCVTESLSNLPISWEHLASPASSKIPDFLQSLDKWQKTPSTQENAGVSSCTKIQDKTVRYLRVRLLKAFMNNHDDDLFSILHCFRFVFGTNTHILASQKPNMLRIYLGI